MELTKLEPTYRHGREISSFHEFNEDSCTICHRDFILQESGAMDKRTKRKTNPILHLTSEITDIT